MKISEIIQEGVGRAAEHPDHASHANTGEWQFRDIGGYNPTYNINRIMMAVAMADGGDKPVDMDEASWVSVFNVARPYSEAEHKMMKQAFKTVKSEVYHTEKDHRSREHPDTHKVSPHRKTGPVKLKRK